MSINRNQLKQAVFQLYQRRGIAGWRPGDAASIISTAATQAGCDLQCEPALGEAKRLLIETVRLMRFVSGVPEPEPASEVQRSLEILFIEDSETFARITMAALRNDHLRYNVRWIKDGAEALSFLDKVGEFAPAPDPDLILLDLGLPHVSGQELLAELRSREEYRDIPVVVMTVSDSPEDRRFCEEWDVADYLIKPVDLHKFRQLVRSLSYRWPDHLVTAAEES